MEYSQKSIRIAYLKYLADQGHDEFGKFLIQQNFIQFELAKLMLLRSKYLDKGFIKKIEEQTLGNLIGLYKICWNSNKTENRLIEILEQYNKSRNAIVHRMIEGILDDKKIEIVDINKHGSEIIQLLDDLLEAELAHK